MMRTNLWSGIKLLALDFDGVLTDGKVIVGSNGVESVACSHLDGQGIESLLRRKGVEVVVISNQKSTYVDHRCRKMGVDCFAGETSKLDRLMSIVAAFPPQMTFAEVCFVGDDLGDLEVMKQVGLPVAVANAVPAIKAIAKYVTTRSGGDGAVREVCDLILSA